jgi:hypothetical protein
VHAGLRRYYAALRTVTQAPVFDRERLAVLWQLLRGDFDADLRAFVAEHYQTPPRVAVPFAALPAELPPGTLWYDAPQLQFVGEGGLALVLDPRAAALAATQPARTIRLQTVGLYPLTIRFVRDGEVVGECTSTPAPPPADADPWRVLSGVRTDIVVVPATMGRFDTLWLDSEGLVPGHATGPAAIGAFVFAH